MDDDNVIPIRPREIIAEVGGPIDETHLTLGIHGDDLDPDEVTAVLRCSPTQAHRRGDPRRDAPPWPRGAWLLSVEGKAPTGPEELLNELLAKLPEDPSIWSGLHHRFTVRLDFGLFLDAWNRGFDLSPAMVQRLSTIGASLGCDIYGEGYEVSSREHR